MAYPFGQTPRLADYLQFLAAQGCVWKVKVAIGNAGRSYRELVITKAPGLHYIMVNPDEDERLGLQVMGNLQRRLGITAPFVPPQPDPPDPGDA